MDLRILFLVVVYLQLISCTWQKKESVSTSKADTIIVLVDTLSSQFTDTLNFTDSKGKKQGVWQTYLNGKLWKEEVYRNGKLHGKHKVYLADGTINETTFKNGIRDGYYSTYQPSSRFAIFITFWRDGEKMWSTFPWDLDEFIIPIKGFLSEHDSVFINIPFLSGQKMYEGQIKGNPKTNHAEAIGMHKAYYETEELRALINYDIDSITVFEKNGRIKSASNIAQWLNGN